MDNSKINMHKRMAMGQKPTAMKKGGAMADPSTFLERRTGVKEGAKKFLKRRLGVGAALGAGAVAVGKAVKKFKDRKAAQKRDKAKVKKMGGGMMKRYSKGGGAENPMKEERFQSAFMDRMTKLGLKDIAGDPRKVERPSKKRAVSGKMGGGMMKRYSKGGGADMGGMRSKMRAQASDLARKMKDKDRLTQRGIAKAKRAVSGKMGGGVAEAARRVRASGMKKGGLKPVDKEKNPGLAKLPTRVRNKMGYMKKGGATKK